MSDPNQPSTPPGWYPDGQGGQRWWDGTQWTEHTQPQHDAGPQTPQAPQPPQVPGADQPTVVAPNRAADFGRPGQPGQPYGAPAGQQPSGQPGGQQPYGAPAGQPPYGQPGFGAPSSGGGKKKLFWIIGAAIGALVLAVVLLIVLLKVVGGGSPEDVVTDYLTAEFEGDYEKECELRSEDSQDSALSEYDVDDCAEYAKEREKADEENIKEYEDEYDLSLDEIRGNFDYEIEVSDVEEKSDDEAIVKVKETYEYTAEDEFLEQALGGDKSDSQTSRYSAVKEDGDWKVVGRVDE